MMTDYIFDDIEEENQCLSLLTLRQYQNELAEMSKKQNTIVFLPTGSGKTIISIHVLRSKMKELTKPNKESRKIAIFLATTKLLVNQLNNVVKECTPLKTKIFSAEMGIDDWPAKTWENEISDVQVLVMVPEILLIIIQRKILCLNNISLIVFDECHHAVFSHPYRQIMQLMDSFPEIERPLVMGLTSTVLNCNPVGDGFKEVKTLKETFKAVFGKPDNLEEALSYGTSAKELIISYDSDPKTNATAHILYLIDQTCLRLSNLKILGIVEEASEKIVPKGSILLNRKNMIVKEMLNILKHVERALQDLGLYPTSLIALYYYIRLERMKLLKKNKSNIVACNYIQTVLNIIRRIIYRYVPMHDENRLRKYSSQKVKSLIKFIEQYKEFKDLKCLILVEERVTAVVLSAMFNELSRNEDTFYKADFITGGLFSSVFDIEESKYEQNCMKAIIQSFREKEFRFLISTDVAEEGIDVPNCNVVIKFDGPKDYRSYIQSKGRARFKNSDYVIFSKTEEKSEVQAQVNKYNNIQQMLLKNLLAVEGIESMVDENETEEDNEEYYYVKGPDGPRISGTKAIAFVTRYCSRFSHDKYSCLIPICWYDTVTETAFLRLPTSCPLQKTIEGERRKNRKLAKKNVFLKTVEELHKIGEVLDDLTFRSYLCIEEEHKELFHILLKVNPENYQGFESNERKKYEVQFAENLSHCLPQPGSVSYIHVIKVEPQFSRPEDPQRGAIYNMFCDPNNFAILSGKQLSKICDFPLFLNIGEVRCSLDVNAATVELKESDIQKLKKFHFFIFNSLLEVVNRLQIINYSDGNHSFFVIPVNCIEEKPVINWSIINGFDELNELCDLKEIIVQNPTIGDYLNRIVYPKYRQSLYINRYYIVTEIDHSQTPMSTFPSEDYENYFYYYMKKYEIRIMNKEQPLILVKCLPERINYLKPRKLSVSKSKRNKSEDNEFFKEYLVPELCELIDFPALLWLKATILPSALYRITTIILIDEMRKKIASETKLGICDLEHDLSWLPLVAESSVTNEEQQKNLHFDWTQSAKQRLALSKEENPELQPPLDIFRHMNECAPCDLIHYVNCFGLTADEDNPVSSPREKKEEPENIFTAELSAIEVPDLPITLENQSNKKGPELRDLIKTFTCLSANDIVNLETLEFLGDAFLKFAAALYAFRNCDSNEGKLVSMKDKIVCNKNLYCCGVVKGLGNILLTNEFDPRSGWSAPLFDLPVELKNLINENNFKMEYLFEIPKKEKLSGILSSKTLKTIQDFTSMEEMRSMYVPDEAVLRCKTVKDKSISDCVESLLGLYVKVMLHSVTHTQKTGSYEECGLVGGFKMLNWFNILPEKTGSFDELMTKKYVTKEGDSEKILKMLTEYYYENLEKILGYQFQNKSLLLEALTHPSVSNDFGLSYQRLEFLGDAVIDFITTSYIYHCNPNLSPGELTDIRISIVNNITMGCLAVKYDFHKYMIYCNSQLMSSIAQFTNFQADRCHKIDDGLLIFNEEGNRKMGEGIEVPKAIGDIFESLAGAIFLDSGNCLDTVWKSYYPLMKDTIEISMKNCSKSPIRKLYENCCPPPKFEYEMNPSGYVVAICKIIHNEKEKLFYGKAACMHSSKLSAAKMAVRYLEGLTVEE